jgi:hypothetical protein
VCGRTAGALYGEFNEELKVIIDVFGEIDFYRFRRLAWFQFVEEISAQLIRLLKDLISSVASSFLLKLEKGVAGPRRKC